ncbi:MAG: Tad domain-containing protein [Alphaproteobacteria bacterium]|nr:Tad domain-containing protein [Alphaproteobacteria bacterium]
MAVSLLALGTATAVGIDFARGLNFKTSLQGAVDSAAIAGASVYLNSGYSSQATTAATNYMTKAQASLPTNNGVTTTIAVSNTAPWTVTVTAKASINSSFNGVLENQIPVQVTATAHGPTNPNIDFYLLLDSSPSMGIAATAAGIQTMINNTQGQCDSPPNGGSSCGCGFACHESNPSSESHYVATGTMNNGHLCTASNNYQYCQASGTGNPGGEDNYALARSLGVTLRIDNLLTATKNLMTTATTTEQSNSATYRVAIYTFDVAVNTIQTLTSNLTTAQNSANNIQMLQVYSNNMLTSSNDNSDEDTNYDLAMNTINTKMPNPGNGTTAAGDTPQEVLMIVTDGVEDEYQCPAQNPTSYTACRQQYLMNSNTDWCSTVKNRGIRIAVLYTTYDPIPNNGWYANFDGSGNGVSSFQSQIAGTLQSCASPGLYFQVNTGGDISAAMSALFTSAVQSAYISN